jgi:putative ABC transport system permease protein
MLSLAKAWRYISFALHRSRSSDELAEEIQLHLDLRAAANQQRGSSEQAARVEAVRRFGNRLRIQEESREAWSFAWIDELRDNTVYALRQLRRAPTYGVVVVATIALGVGVNATLFSIASAVFARPLPGIRSSDELYWVNPRDRDGHVSPMSYPDYIDYANSPIFSTLAAYADRDVAFAIGGNSERVHAEFVTVNFFATLGTKLAAGRELTTRDGKPFVVISFDMWRRAFGLDPTVTGRAVQINGLPATIAGVAPEGFNGAELGEQRDIWVPIDFVGAILTSSSNVLTRRSEWWLYAIGRLSPGVTPSAAAERIRVIASRLAKENPTTHRNESAVITAARTGLAPGSTSRVAPLFAMAAVVALVVLLTAATNAAGMILSRGITRRREIATRIALGATRGRLIRQFLTETIVLVAFAGVLGISLAVWLHEGIMGLLRIDIPLDFRPDWRLGIFGVVIVAVTTVLCGLAPAATATRVDLATAIADGSVGRNPRSGVRGAFVVAQVALSYVLLVVAGLFLHSVSKQATLDLGYETSDRILAVDLDVRLAARSGEEVETFLQLLLERARSIAGASRVAIASQSFLGSHSEFAQVTDAGAGGAIDPAGRRSFTAFQNVISVDYFPTVGIPLLAGRPFAESDIASSARVAIVSRRLARRLWIDGPVLGRSIRIVGDSLPAAVVGISKDVLVNGGTVGARDMVYLPAAQHPVAGRVTLYVRTNADARGIIGPTRSLVSQLGLSVPIATIETLAELRREKLALTRHTVALLLAFGIVALLLACIGLYGVSWSAVASRRREIGIRIALGATAGRIARRFIRHGFALAALGIAVGTILALGISLGMSKSLIGVSPTDSVSFGGSAVLLTLTTLLASYLPARRAAKMAPMRSIAE